MGQNAKISELPANPAVGDILYRKAAITYAAQYPPAQNATYVKANELNSVLSPFFATDPTILLTGEWANRQWVAPNNNPQRFHIDLGSAKIIQKIYYENGHDSGDPAGGAKNFTFWGSNNAAAFSELTYATDTNWTQLTIAASQFDIHASADAADPKYILVTNAIAYRYYAFKFADVWTGPYMNIRRIVLYTYPNSPDMWANLPIGTSGQTLKVAATLLPAWTT
ncbi:MAG: hypothetical protein PHS46_08475 [Candidatus Omnitrophica bacterium]|nr:hypothetical protein [Candidatus Omnitrophota bacterium]